jgi:hypothetical protein
MRKGWGYDEYVCTQYARWGECCRGGVLRAPVALKGDCGPSYLWTQDCASGCCLLSARARLLPQRRRALHRRGAPLKSDAGTAPQPPAAAAAACALLRRTLTRDITCDVRLDDDAKSKKSTEYPVVRTAQSGSAHFCIVFQFKSSEEF